MSDAGGGPVGNDFTDQRAVWPEDRHGYPKPTARHLDGEHLPMAVPAGDRHRHQAPTHRPSSLTTSCGGPNRCRRNSSCGLADGWDPTAPLRRRIRA